jgi:probable rRNA maturation factor
MAVRVEVCREADVRGLDDAVVVEVVERAVRAVLRDRGVSEAEFSVTLLDDDGMAALNREWKGRDVATDVLAFALHEDGEPPLGDVYLGADRAVEQGEAEGEPIVRELARMTIHGTLHVLGFDHDEVDREASELWRHQERILSTIDPT